MSFRNRSNATHILKDMSIAEIIDASPSTPFGRADKKSRTHLLDTVISLSGHEQQLIFNAALARHRPPTQISEVLNVLTMDEIIGASPTTSFDRADRKNRARLLTTVANLPESEKAAVCSAAVAKQQPIMWDDDGLPASKRRRIEEESSSHEGKGPDGGEMMGMAMEEVETEDEEQFLRAPTPEVVERCIAKFIDRTSNNALARETCMSCARTIWRTATTELKVDQIPNHELLYPHEPHEAHILTGGMLLYDKVVHEGPSGKQGRLCDDCVRNLKACKRPKLSLANGMWIGELPHELSVLTVPETILIARYYPAAFVIKLFPKVKGARQWKTDGLNSSVCGNVSTYRLNTVDIADMVNPSIMPPPAHILAAIIAVTIIGPRGLPEKTMPGFLKVRRSKVRAALVWLKSHNPLYADIAISEEMLSQFPESDIPEEILATVKYSDDTDQLERERAGYVVEDDDEEEGKGMPASVFSQGLKFSPMSR